MVRYLRRRYAESSEHVREIVRGASIAFPLRAVGMLAGFTLNVALARILGADSAGLYLLAFTLTLIIAGLGTRGLGQRRASADRERGDTARLEHHQGSPQERDAGRDRRHRCSGDRGRGVRGLALRGRVPETRPRAHPPVDGTRRTPGVALRSSGFRSLGLKRIPAGVFVSHIGTPSFALAGVLVLAPVWGPEGAAVAYGGAAMVTLGIGIWQWRRVARPHAEVRAAYPVSALLESGTPLFWANLLQLIIPWTPIVLLGVWSSGADVGIFASAHRTAAVTGFAFLASSSILSPKLAELIGRRELWPLARTTKASSELMLLVASPFFLLLFLFSSRVMGVFGPDFLPGATTLQDPGGRAVLQRRDHSLGSAPGDERERAPRAQQHALLCGHQPRAQRRAHPDLWNRRCRSGEHHDARAPELDCGLACLEATRGPPHCHSSVHAWSTRDEGRVQEPYPYIAGSECSVSTLRDTALGSHPQILGMGEVERLPASLLERAR